MDRDSNVKALANTALATALAVIIAIVGLFVPVLALASLLWPVPVIVIVKRYGLRYGVYSTIASGLIVGMISEPIYAAYVILSYGALGLSIGYGVHKDYRAGRILTITSVVSLLSKLLLMYAVTRIMGVNPLEVQIESMEKGLELSMGFYGRMGLDVPEEMREALFSSFELLKITLPALLIIVAIMDSYLNYTVARIVLKRLGLTLDALPPFAEWRAPGNLTVGFLLLMVLSIAGGYLGLGNIDVIMGNILLLFQMVFLVQGVSVAYFFLLRRGVNKILRILLIVLILFNQPLALAAMFAGILDVLFDFRKRFTQKGGS
ncbi:MAG: YybS family protein [Bacillota bacterium]|jgi:uncharacterized protein YybS (DUF2232 family)|nr:YybS family protein [Bacillota bacterium]MDD3298005.1 YybS family protein [Bacillota bacterium]MDD4706727.1 YybS family protein [Bacillota bacterium]